MNGNKAVIRNRYEFITAFGATLCNPNGDPDMSNAPRQDPNTGYGYVTDVAMKRWLRNYVDDAYEGEDGYEILMRRGTNLNKKIAEAVFAANGVDNVDDLKKDKKKVKDDDSKAMHSKVAESAEYMCGKFWDCRTFGGVLSTGLNAGQIRGAVQIEMAKSASPIRVEDLTVTRMCYAKKEDKKLKTIAEYEEAEKNVPDDEKRTMGEKQIVYYGLYVLRGTVSAPFAERTGFTKEDLRVLCEALIQMIPHNASSSKSGMNLELPLILFKHVGTQGPNNQKQNEREARLGCVPAQNLFRLLKIEKKPEVAFPNEIGDYEISFDLSALPRGVEVGFKTLPFEDFVWGDEIRNGNYGIKIT